VLNGHTIHENVTVSGPTRSAAFADEQPLGPLMIQGDHGPVALRRLAVKRFEPGLRIAAEQLAYKLYASAGAIGSYDRETPQAAGPLPRFSQAAVEKSGRFALVVTGRLVVPRAGDYRFATEASGLTRLLIGGQPVVTPLDRGGSPGVVALAAGAHDFRLDLVHATGARPALDLFAEGPGLAPQALTVREEGGRGPGRGGPRAGAARQLLVEPADRPLVQRGFVPFDPRKRLYAASVGTPAGVHFAYDFETGTVLRAWRGSFVDTFSMWDGRGNDQLAKPAGPALTFHGKPTVAHIEYARDGDWPAASPHRPVLRTVNGRRQLAVPLAGAALEKPLSYSIVW